MNQVSYISRMLLRVILLIGLVLHVSAAMADQSPCPKVIITSKDTIDFSDTEKRLLCGDRDDKAWEDIPSYQAQFFMRSFLQSRAYLEPTFEIKNDVLYVHPGEKVELKSLEIIPKSLVEKEAIEKELLPVFEKKPLTPSLLNELQASSVGILREKAYACAKAKAYAQVVNSHVVIELENLSRYKFGDIQIEDTGGVYEQALKRFYPFNSEQAFD
ncbi:MAG: hypothetical protein KC478_16775, partial [Bacteriovoracaceae bacterium]|nr:hypothetical protein [Bacteriovoracaceae bacterium]